MRILAVLLVIAAWPAHGQSPDIEALITKIAAYEHGQSRGPLVDFEAALAASLPSADKIRDIEARLVRLLQSSATLAGKDFACRQLSIIGTGASVPVLGKMLLAAETSDMARYALERMPAAEAGAALRNALPKTSGKTKIGIVNSLGARRDAQAIRALSGLIQQSDAAVASAALSALAAIGGDQATRTIAGARQKLSGALRQDASEAQLRCAASVESKRAAAIYRELLAKDEPEMIRIAALLGFARTAGRESLPALREAAMGEGRLQAAAISALGGMPGPDATAVLTGAFAKATPGARVRILGALAVRPDAAKSVEMFSTAAKSDSPEVRIAALTALGDVGGARAVDLLAQSAAAASTEAEQNAARESLYRLRGADVDAAILKSLRAAVEPKLKVELIRSTSERGLAAAADALLETARDGDRDVRRESIRALKDTAGPRQVPALIALLADTKNASDRVEVERTTAYVVKRSDPAPIGTIVSAYEKAQTPVLRGSLLQILGQAGEAEGLPVLRGALNDGDAQIVRAAILAMSEWPSPEPMPDLRTVAKESPNPAHRVLALRGYIKLATLPAQRPVKETVSLLAGAMSLAAQPEEKKAVLAALQRYPSPDALSLAEASLKDESVAAEAKIAADRIKSALAARPAR